MHELSIASGLVEKLLSFANENPDKQIVEVRLAVGEFSNIEEEQLRFCFSAVIAETAIEGSTLDIEQIKAVVECRHCSYRGSPKYWDGALSFTPVPTLECPACGKTTEAVEGNDCAIRSIRFSETVAL